MVEDVFQGAFEDAFEEASEETSGEISKEVPGEMSRDMPEDRFKGKVVGAPEEKCNLELALYSFSGWDEETRLSFTSRLIDYETIPKYKKVLGSMIKFEKMYQPLSKGMHGIDFGGVVKNANERRRARRLQIYLNKRDLIATYDDKEGRKLVVTSRGHKVFYDDYPLARLRRQKWDGRWTIVMYDVPETMRRERNWLRRQLEKFGYGSPQRSVWVNPLPVADPIHEFIEAEDLASLVWVLRAERVLGMDNKTVASRSWPLKEINGLYNKLITILPEVRDSADREALLDDWRRCFLAVNADDPCLPNKLLPEDWHGYDCEKMFERLGFKGFVKCLLSRFRK